MGSATLQRVEIGNVDRRTTKAMPLLVSEWAAHATEADREYLFLVAARLAGAQLDADEGDAVEALQQAQADLGLASPPSRPKYRQWFAAQPPEAGWPSPYEIEQAFGTWTKARQAAAGTHVPVSALALPTLGGYPSDDDLLSWIRCWHEREPDPRRRYRRFRDFVTQALAAGNGTGLRHAVSNSTYIAHFGSWPHAVEEAGLLEGMSFADYRRLMCGLPPYSDGDLIDYAWDWAGWAEHRGERLTTASLSIYRTEKLRAAWLAGEVKSVPDAGTFAAHFGSLFALLERLGLADRAGYPRSRGRNSDYSRERVLEWLRRAAVDLGDAFGDSRYKRWRLSRLSHGEGPIPCSLTVRRRLKVRTMRDAVTVALSST